ncbi:hypothetical protein K440DRAFT_619946 [Wilcoxina mikolae CBS 423.85]|nr:hypothetical protein K440DRAFT_619946 [Wilcoxina mikolae CBS 423.85]
MGSAAWGWHGWLAYFMGFVDGYGRSTRRWNTGCWIFTVPPELLGRIRTGRDIFRKDTLGQKVDIVEWFLDLARDCGYRGLGTPKQHGRR